MRIGILGGTFDPVHYGHLRPVEAVAGKLALDSVIYVPALISPFKEAAPEDSRHRVAMLALALQGNPARRIAFDELDREPPSYTVDTLRALSARYRGDELWLLMGTDMLAGLDRWRQPDEILRLARIAAFQREPFVGKGLRIPVLPGLAGRLEVFDTGSVRISSSDLRADLARGESAGDRVPGPVAEYITKQGLYRSGMAAR